MHLSDTLVIGPLPLRTQPVRVPVRAALAVGFLAVLAAITVAAAGSAPRLLGNALAPRAPVLPTGPRLPGSAIADRQVLADGRMGLAVAGLVGPNERQAWLFDPVQASVQRIGSPVRGGAPPAGEVVAPDGQHAIPL